VKKAPPSPEKTADQVARAFFGVGPDKASRQRAIRGLLLAAVESVVLVPLLFYWRFGEVTDLGWGLTVFFVAYCLLAAIGLYFQPISEFHTPVKLRGDWIDHVGAFWLVSCAFGPFFGWVVTSVFPITVSSWRWLYALRVFLAIVLPLITALPLTRYLRGKATLVALPILVVITLLPIWSAVNFGRDLWNGPVVQQAQNGGQLEYYLPYTERGIDLTH
jgi:predicted membrane channel-forming protein YqfA (hemolysin III family)